MNVWNLTDKHLDVVDSELGVRHPAGQKPEIYSFPNAVLFVAFLTIRMEANPNQQKVRKKQPSFSFLRSTVGHRIIKT